MVASNRLQPTRLAYEHKVVTHQLALIFVTTECNRFGDISEHDKEAELIRIVTESIEGDDGETMSSGQQQITRQSLDTKQDWDSYYIGGTPYANALERGEVARHLFEDVLHF